MISFAFSNLAKSIELTKAFKVYTLIIIINFFIENIINLYFIIQPMFRKYFKFVLNLWATSD